jgi:argininosuccinate lyase
VRQNVPLRTAHELTGQLVRTSIERKLRLSDLSLDDFRAVYPAMDEGVYGVLGVDNAVKAFVSYGSTAPAEVAKQVQRWQEKVAKEAHNTAGAT